MLIAVQGLCAAPRVSGPAPAASLSITARYEGRLVAKLMDVRTDQIVEGRSFRIGARLHTAGALGVLKSANFLAQAQGPMLHGAPAPSEFVSDDGKRRRVVRFHNVSPRSAGDPLTQLLRVALAPEGASPCLGALRVEDGRQTYDLILSPAGAGNLSGAQTGFGLSHAVRCGMGFHPVAGFKPGASLRNPFMNGEVTTTFARLATADVWVLSDIAVGTVLGEGHIALTGLQITGARPAPLTAAPIASAKNRRR